MYTPKPAVRLQHSITCLSIFQGQKAILPPNATLIFVNHMDDLQGLTWEDIYEYMQADSCFRILVQVVPMGLPSDDPAGDYLDENYFGLAMELSCEELRVSFRIYGIPDSITREVYRSFMTHTLCHRLGFEFTATRQARVVFYAEPNLYEVFRRLIDCLRIAGTSVLDLSAYNPFVAAACLDNNVQYDGFTPSTVRAQHTCEVLDLYPTNVGTVGGDTTSTTVETVGVLYPTGAITLEEHALMVQSLPNGRYGYKSVEDRKLKNHEPRILFWFLNKQAHNQRQRVAGKIHQMLLDEAEIFRKSIVGMPEEERRIMLVGEWKTES